MGGGVSGGVIEDRWGLSVWRGRVLGCVVFYVGPQVTMAGPDFLALAWHREAPARGPLGLTALHYDGGLIAARTLLVVSLTTPSRVRILAKGIPGHLHCLFALPVGKPKRSGLRHPYIHFAETIAHGSQSFLLTVGQYLFVQGAVFRMPQQPPPTITTR